MKGAIDIETFFNTCFASCNGYGGFRSYFDVIFNPKHYDYLVILKGGPGSGKSTFMKGLDKKFQNGFFTERVLCSSDKSSLDGVIIKGNGKSVAVIDGTAPHTQDPKFPGAVDEIVNLGEYWNSESLQRQRGKIIELSENKEMHYKNAYAYLSFIKKEYQDVLIDNFSDLIKSRNVNQRIVSSFSKDGYYRILSEKFWKISKSINADLFSASAYIKSEIARMGNDNLTVFISPFDHSIIEGYYNESSEELVLFDFDCADEEIFLEGSRSHPIIERNLPLAQKEFSLASTAHFELENIYTKEMDFERMNNALNDVVKKIERFFST